MTTFSSQTAVTRIDKGRYSAEMDRSWWIVSGPNGGYVATIVLRAICAEVDEPRRSPRSISLQFLRVPQEGEVLIEVVVERSGRSVSNVSARMTQNGQLLVMAMAVLAESRESSLSFDELPGLPLLADGSVVPTADQLDEESLDASREVPMSGHYEQRWVIGGPPFEPLPFGQSLARTGGWLRPVGGEPIDALTLTAMTDAWLPPIFSRVSETLLVPTVDLTIHLRGLPADPYDFCFVLFESPVARDGYLIEHGQIFDSQGLLLAESRQLAVVV
ncbi:MAG: thioesterase family protein [Microthrixaceae bacterium]